MQRTSRCGDHHPALSGGEGYGSGVLENLGDCGGDRQFAAWLLQSPIPGAVIGMDRRVSLWVMIEARFGGSVSAELIPPQWVLSRRLIDVDQEVL